MRQLRLPADLPGGHYELTVTLSTNDHLEYSHDREPIGSVITIGMVDMVRMDDEDSVEHDHSEENHTPPVVADDATVEILHGVGRQRDRSLTLGVCQPPLSASKRIG
jgi:hypothetical protein